MSLGRKLFTLVTAALFFYVASPMLLPVMMGGVLAVLFWPWVGKLEALKGIGRSGAAGLLTVGITLLVLIPTSLLIFFVAKAGIQQLQLWRDTPRVGDSWAEAVLATPGVRRILVWITHWFPVGMEELLSGAQEPAQSVALKAAEILANLFAALPGMVVALAVIVVSIYFFLVDGDRLVVFFRRVSVFSEEQTSQLLTALGSICRSVILASVISGAAQAIFETIVCLATGTPNVPLIAAMVFISSFVPVVGSAPVTLGVAMQEFLAGRTAVGVALVISAFIVTTIDSVLRPLFLKGAANMHPLLAFIAAFGGLQTLGFSGIFLGPIIAALFIVTIQILAQGKNTWSALHSDDTGSDSTSCSPA